MNTLKRITLGIVSAILCAGSVETSTACAQGVEKMEEITVSAAASLSNAFTAIVAAFEQANPGVRVHTNFAASNSLLRQIREGAPVSLFASADQHTMDEAADFVVPGSRVDFADNSLVLIVPQESGQDLSQESGQEKFVVRGRADLPRVARLAVGNPNSVPAGRYAREALGKDWDSLRERMIFANSVRQVLDYVSRGEVDAGIVYHSDMLAAAGKVRFVEELTGHTPVLYPMALIKPENAEARKFADFVSSHAGKKILEKHGFTPLP